jgi:hypothetical protein
VRSTWSDINSIYTAKSLLIPQISHSLVQYNTRTSNFLKSQTQIDIRTSCLTSELKQTIRCLTNVSIPKVDSTANINSPYCYRCSRNVWHKKFNLYYTPLRNVRLVFLTLTIKHSYGSFKVSNSHEETISLYIGRLIFVLQQQDSSFLSYDSHFMMYLNWSQFHLRFSGYGQHSSL